MLEREDPDDSPCTTIEDVFESLARLAGALEARRAVRRSERRHRLGSAQATEEKTHKDP